MNSSNKTPYYLRIVEQPAKEARFRYLREARTTSSIVGENSNKSNKTFPTITTNYRGRIRLITVPVDKDCRPHPHGLVGPNCKNGLCVFETDITDERCNIVYRQSIGIQCAKKPDVPAAMLARQKELYGDPFRRGYDHSTYDSIDLHEVRLAFVALIPDASGRPQLPIMPVASNIIRDTKASMHLRILHTSACRGPATGGSEVTLLTETVSQMSTVKLMFHEPSTGWFEYADRLLMHKRVAFMGTVPPYHKQNITKSVFVECFLVREHEHGGVFDPAVDRSETLTFEYLPSPRSLPAITSRDLHLDLSCDSKELKRLEAAYLKPRPNEGMEPLSLKMQPATVEPPYHLQPHSSMVQPLTTNGGCLIGQIYQEPPTSIGQSYQKRPHSSKVQPPSIKGGYSIGQPYRDPTTIGQSWQKRHHSSPVQPSLIEQPYQMQPHLIKQSYQVQPYSAAVQPPLINDGCPIGPPYQEPSPSIRRSHEIKPHSFTILPPSIDDGYPIGLQKRLRLSTIRPPDGEPYQTLPQPTIEQPRESLSLQHLLLKRKKEALKPSNEVEAQLSLCTGCVLSPFNDIEMISGSLSKLNMHLPLSQ